MADRLILEAAGCDITVNWYAEGYQWRTVLDDFKREFGHVAEFDGDARRWRVPSSQRDAVRAWGRRWFSDEEIVDRTGGYRSQRDRYTRHRTDNDQQQQAPKPPTRLEQAYSTLHLLPSAPDELIASAHRILARLHHPDVGGDHGKMVAVRRLTRHGQTHTVSQGLRRRFLGSPALPGRETERGKQHGGKAGNGRKRCSLGKPRKTRAYGESQTAQYPNPQW